MKKKLKPQGRLILVLPSKEKNHITDSNIEIVQSELSEGVIIDYSEEFEGIYKKQQEIIFPEKRGTSIFYNGKPHIYLNGDGYPKGDVMFMIEDDKK